MIVGKDKDDVGTIGTISNRYKQAQKSSDVQKAVHGGAHALEEFATIV